MIKANLAVTGADPEDYDLLLLPGGKAPAALRRSDAVLDLARTFATQGKPIAAICHGPQILISAGLAQGRQMTGYKSVAGELEDARAYYLDQPLVSDGNFITARQPEDLPIFVDAVLGALDLRPNER